MRDQEIRAALHETELKKFYENGDLILDELGVCSGASRVDVAVINGALHGYEIKSDQDTLDRLPQQILSYSRVLDRVTLVACDNHL
ncbi:sce7726 family protein, partial [Desulfovibrio sp.]|uniref:sce7726 family protein n=1 Tax=Desulfovibrio sp. TaxID=885 RepID=UPI0026312F90